MRRLSGITKKIYNIDNYLYHASAKLFKRKPRLLPGLSRLYALYCFTKKNPLRLVDIAITSKCQYNCPHCYPEGFYDKNKKELTPAKIAEIAQEAKELGVIQLNFQGGEPTLDLDRLQHIVTSVDPYSLYISLSTNGFRSKKSDLKRIYEFGVDKLSISLHSGLSEEHDMFVGWQGAFKNALLCAKNSRSAGLEVTFALVVTKDTVRSEGVRKVIDLCIKQKNILDINVAMPVGRWVGRNDVLLKDEDYRWLKRLNKQYPNIRRDLHPHLFREGCLAAKEIMYINVYGEVFTCPFIHFKLGNAGETPLKKLREKALKSKWFSIHQPKCLACEDKEFLQEYVSRNIQTRNSEITQDDFFQKLK